MTKFDPDCLSPMEDYDGDGWLYICAPNTGFGGTPVDAYESWQRGEDIGEHAMTKWTGIYPEHFK